MVTLRAVRLEESSFTSREAQELLTVAAFSVAEEPFKVAALTGRRLFLLAADPSAGASLARTLSTQTCVPSVAATVEDAQRLLRHHSFDAMLVDVEQCDEAGATLVRQLRLLTEIPMTAITPPVSVRERVALLEGGADFVMTKPVAPEELLMRITVLIRRYRRIS